MQEGPVMREVLFLVKHAPGGFQAISLQESIVTQGETLDELEANIRDALRSHFKPGKGPESIRFHFVDDTFLAL